MTVLEALKNSGGAVLVDDLVSRTGLTVGEVSSQLTILEINGQAKELGGRWRFVAPVKGLKKKRVTVKTVSSTVKADAKKILQTLEGAARPLDAAELERLSGLNGSRLKAATKYAARSGLRTVNTAGELLPRYSLDLFTPSQKTLSVKGKKRIKVKTVKPKPVKARSVKPKAVKKSKVSKLAGTQVVVVNFCRHAYQDPANGQFISKLEAQKRGAVVTSVKLENKPRPKRLHSRGVLKQPLENGSYALYRVKRSKSGRDIVSVVKFVDPKAESTLKATKDADIKFSILSYKRDIRSTVQKELQLEYDNDFQNNELGREVRSSIGKRSAVARAANKIKGVKPARKAPTKTEAQTAVVKLSREIEALTVKINKPGVSKSKTASRATQKRKQSFLQHWNAVTAGKKSTYPKGWRK